MNHSRSVRPKKPGIVTRQMAVVASFWRDRRRAVDQPAEEEEPGDAVGLEAQVVVAVDDDPALPQHEADDERGAEGEHVRPAPLEAAHRRHGEDGGEDERIWTTASMNQ